MKSLSHVLLFANPWTVAYQAPPSMGFSRQEYWSGLPFPSPGNLPNPGIEPRSPALQADTLTSEPPGKPYSFRIQTNFFAVTKLFNFHGIFVLWCMQSYQWWIYFMKTVAFKIQIWCFKLGAYSLPWWISGKESACSAKDVDLIPGLGGFPEGNGNPLHYFCLGKPMDGEAWWATLHEVTKEPYRLSN